MPATTTAGQNRRGINICDAEILQVIKDLTSIPEGEILIELQAICGQWNPSRNHYLPMYRESEARVARSQLFPCTARVRRNLGPGWIDENLHGTPAARHCRVISGPSIAGRDQGNSRTVLPVCEEGDYRCSVPRASVKAATQRHTGRIFPLQVERWTLAGSRSDNGPLRHLSVCRVRQNIVISKLSASSTAFPASAGTRTDSHRRPVLLFFHQLETRIGDDSFLCLPSLMPRACQRHSERRLCSRTSG